jgi:predicted dehydrogenase
MDLQEALAKELAGKVGCAWTTSQEELLARKDVEAVYLAVPHHLHAPIAIACARAGKHVMVEKPISVTLEQADQMIAECAKNKVVLCVAFVGRYPRATQQARELVRAGAIGKVIALKIGFYTDKPETYWKEGFTRRAKTDWRSARAKSGGGILVMNCIHNYDKLRFITGLEAVRVQAEMANFLTPGVEVEDYFAGTVRFDNGAIGTIYCSSAARGRGDRVDSILGTAGQIVLDEGVIKVFLTEERQGIKAGEWVELKFDPIPGQGPRQVIANEFAEAIWGGKPSPVPGSEGRKDQEFMVAAYRAAETHKPVELPLKK